MKRKLTRRAFLAGTASAAALSAFPRARSFAASKPPYKVLFSNDTTHLEYCISPYRERGERFSRKLLEASVDETADIGVDVHMLQPGTGWVPWWKSSVYDPQEHYRWWGEHYDVPLSGFAEYMLQGGDMVEVFAARCRQRGLAPFVSLRMNDQHGLEFAGAPVEKVQEYLRTTPEFWWMTQLSSRVYADHPEYRIDADSYRKVDWLWDWRIPEVREHKRALVQELCSNYDLDGVELDLNRDPFYFNTRKTTSEERRRIMTGFLVDVRSMLDASKSNGARKHLCLRIPNVLESYDRMGLDVGAATEAGVDMLNVSSSFYTNQVFDIEAIRKQIPRETAVYLEMTHCTSLGNIVTKTGYDSATFRRTTDTQFRTTANLAYEQGADGISLFNFVYYRESEGKDAQVGGPWREPPFHAIKALRDPEGLRQGRQRYFLGNPKTFSNFFPRTAAPYRQLPQNVATGETASFTMNMAPSTTASQGRSTLTIQTSGPVAGGEWTASLNGVFLGSGTPTEPEQGIYTNALSGSIETLWSWSFSGSHLLSGINDVTATLMKGDAGEIIFVSVDASPETLD